MLALTQLASNTNRMEQNVISLEKLNWFPWFSPVPKFRHEAYQITQLKFYGIKIQDKQYRQTKSTRYSKEREKKKIILSFFFKY